MRNTTVLSTTPTLLLNILLRQRHRPLVSRPRRRSLHPTPPIIQIILSRLNILIYPLTDLQKRPLDVLPALRACLDILHHLILATPLLRLLLCHLPLVLLVGIAGDGGGGREVRLVADEDYDNIVFGDLAEVVQPGGHGVEGRAARDVEDEQGAGCAAEVGARDGFVGFLPGRVPEAQLHVLLALVLLLALDIVRRPCLGRTGGDGGVVDVVLQACWRTDWDYAGAELDADGDVVVGDEAAFTEPDGQLRLSAAC